MVYNSEWQEHAKSEIYCQTGEQLNLKCLDEGVGV